ncbi:unnamed protein product [Paramecium sonneborni]|uniref:Uncharacterized protein n=1 Tax=Paramecium sonneborni TaxID=65129 RepID=A0A8S1NDV9_9CILI|nr:unnamed protein product [Paramecium sonneborni]
MKLKRGWFIKNEYGKEEFQKIEIDPKNYKYAMIEQEKLRTQNGILDYLSTLKQVPNYKTILTSFNQIQAMLDVAVNRRVKIDDQEEAEKKMVRLRAEVYQNNIIKYQNRLLFQMIKQLQQQKKEWINNIQQVRLQNQGIKRQKLFKLRKY